MKRIIPISSGKGGVGKTSFAVNLALCLSRQGKTILVDIDTGTSSIRNVVSAPIKRDLYHFFKRGASLGDCVTPLPGVLDSDRIFSNFGFIASPMHMINDIANMDEHYRNKLIDGINGLEADYVVLDLRAGLDPCVTDFLPLSNSGILVFTPNHPAATLAASDVVKAALFRKLREVFHLGSPLFQLFDMGSISPEEINEMIDKAEDVYESELPNLDAFITALDQRLPSHRLVRKITDMIEYFRVYYVLNRFDGVDNSFQTAVKPFVENIANNISTRPSLSNLGWIIESERYNQANVDSIPFMIQQTYEEVRQKSRKEKKSVDQQMTELYELAGLRKEKPAKRTTKVPKGKTQSILDEQLNAIQKMFHAKQGENEIQNFNYILSSIRYLFQSKRVSDFGDTRLFKRGEALPLFLR